MILRARIILPVTRPLIEDGAVRVEGNRIIEAGKWRHLKSSPNQQVVDLGERALLPGLINGHCHLDYTEMAGQIPRPKAFPDWIKALLALKAHWSYSDYAQSWLRGARMLLRRGVTSVADIEAVPELLPEVWTATPLRVFSFLEMTGVRSGRPPTQILQEAVTQIDSLPKGRGAPGLSPHAPYSTSPELLKLSADSVQRRNWRVTIHVAESQEEFDMFTSRRGPLFGWLKNQREMSDCGRGSPVQHLDRQGLLSERLLSVHVNYLAEGDAELLGKRRVSVVHCPRSHAYFQHDPFPHPDLVRAGVNVCLGTDSLVSVHVPRRQKAELDMFAEMRAFSEQAPEVSPEVILKMATAHGARALGLSGKIGEISPGALADLIALPLRNADPYEAVLQHSGEVTDAMIDGAWAWRADLE